MYDIVISIVPTNMKSILCARFLCKTRMASDITYVLYHTNTAGNNVDREHSDMNSKLFTAVQCTRYDT